MKILPFGERAFLVDLELDAAEKDRSQSTLSLAASLARRFPGADVVPGAGAVLVAGAPMPEDAGETLDADAPLVRPPARPHAVRVVYDGPDLDDVARAVGRSPEAVIALHAGGHYTVELLGFLPGFAYLEGLDPALVLPRRATPRHSVARGSVGIAGDFTGIYPFASPGGWNLVGRSIDAVPFDPERPDPFLFRPGDAVCFERVEHGDAPLLPPEPRSAEPARGVVIVRAPACATVQDRGRAGQLARGMPPSGAWDPEAYAAANLAVGNEGGEASIEIPQGALEIRARGDVRVSVDGAGRTTLRDGETLRVEAGDRAVRYLAVAGGVDVPLVLGSRSTLLVARLGGFRGRALRRGDVVPVAEDHGRGGCLASLPQSAGVVRVAAGPHLRSFPPGALDAFIASTWLVSRLGDRVGVRLEGARVPREGGDSGLPVPMIRGAIQVTSDGTPIVFGPDHPTTGGYPVLAVVPEDAWSALAARFPGSAVRFCLC